MGSFRSFYIYVESYFYLKKINFKLIQIKQIKSINNFQTTASGNIIQFCISSQPYLNL